MRNTEAQQVLAAPAIREASERDAREGIEQRKSVPRAPSENPRDSTRGAGAQQRPTGPGGSFRNVTVLMAARAITTCGRVISWYESANEMREKTK